MQSQELTLSILEYYLFIDLTLSHDHNEVFSLQMILHFLKQNFSLFLSVSIILSVVSACYLHQYLLYAHIGYAFIAVS